ncbi:kinase-like domain-containing protein, partial [Phascolomyces articulosus]
MAKPLANNGSTLSTLQSIGDYTFLNFLHQGNNAQIKMAEHRTTRERNEYKTRETGALERLRDKHAYREAQILLLLRHPYLPRIYDFISTADHHYLVMEHVNGIPLLFRVIQQEYLSEASARHYAHQVWRILDYLHGHAIVHLDIRIDNLILKQEQDQIKLLDFSTACLYLGWKKEEKQALYKRQHLCRSIHYTAPELLDPSNETFEGPPVDIWNFGILIYIMVTGEMPFEGYSPEQVSRHIQSIDPQGKDNKQGHPHPHLRYLDRLSPECRHLIQSMLAINPRERISLAQVAQHPW